MTIWFALAGLAGLAIAFLLGRSMGRAGNDAGNGPVGTESHKALWAMCVAFVALVGAGVHFGRDGPSDADYGLDPQVWEPAASAVDAGAAAGGLPDVETMVRRLADRLAAAPDDPDGWRMLGWSYMALDRPEDAAKAYRRAIALSGDVARYRTGLGEALVKAAAGTVTPAALESFRAAIERDPRDARARYFVGLAKQQAGDLKGAYDAWVALLNEAPGDAPWRRDVGESVMAVAAKLGMDPSSVPEAARTASHLADGPATEERSHRAAIRRLTDRTAKNPRDYEAWIGLVRAYSAVGEVGRAREVLETARKNFAGAPFVLGQLDQMAADLESGAHADASTRGPTADDVAAAQSMSPESRTQMINGMVERLAARLAAAPDDPDGWRMLARSYGVLGETAKAIAAYETLLEMRPDDVPALRGYAETMVKTVPPETPYPPRVVAALSRLLKSAPQDAFARSHLAEASRRKGKGSE